MEQDVTWLCNFDPGQPPEDWKYISGGRITGEPQVPPGSEVTLEELKVMSLKGLYDVTVQHPAEIDLRRTAN
jgi:hypothetical protein